MKYTSIIFLALLALLTSCNKETEVLFDFSGTYEGSLECLGELSDSAGEAITIIIRKTETEGIYSIDLGDEVIFNGSQNENNIVIDPQTINEDLGFDVVYFEGEIRQLGNEVMFEFIHNVDDEGESTCSFPIVKI